MLMMLMLMLMHVDERHAVHVIERARTRIVAHRRRRRRRQVTTPRVGPG